MATPFQFIDAFENGDGWLWWGLTYVSSGVSEKLGRCYQVMETEDRAFLEQGMANWSDLVDFEISSQGSCG